MEMEMSIWALGNGKIASYFFFFIHSIQWCSGEFWICIDIIDVTIMCHYNYTYIFNP